MSTHWFGTLLPARLTGNGRPKERVAFSRDLRLALPILSTLPAPPASHPRARVLLLRNRAPRLAASGRQLSIEILRPPAGTHPFLRRTAWQVHRLLPRSPGCRGTIAPRPRVP